jgi:hypothetical protein
MPIGCRIHFLNTRRARSYPRQALRPLTEVNFTRFNLMEINNSLSNSCSLDERPSAGHVDGA